MKGFAFGVVDPESPEVSPSYHFLALVDLRCHLKQGLARKKKEEQKFYCNTVLAFLQIVCRNNTTCFFMIVPASDIHHEEQHRGGFLVPAKPHAHQISLPCLSFSPKAKDINAIFAHFVRSPGLTLISKSDIH